MKIYGRYLQPYTTLTGVLFSLYFFCLRSEITTLTSAIDHINSTTNCQKFIKYPMTKTSFPDGISVVFSHPLGLTVAHSCIIVSLCFVIQVLSYIHSDF